MDDNSLDKNILSSIPDAFFRREFSLADPKVLSLIQGQDAATVGGHNVLLEKMSTQLDAVEMRLIAQISERKDSIFATLADFQALNDRIRETCEHIQIIRKKISRMDRDMVASAVRVAQLKRKRNNLTALYGLIRTISTVHQTQPTIQLLLSTSDFAGALDLIASTQIALRTDLACVHAFKHLHAQLAEMEVAIERVMQADFLSIVLEDEESIKTQQMNSGEVDSDLLEGHKDKEHLESQLVPLVLGLRRVSRLQKAIEEYRELLVQRVRPVLRNSVVKANQQIIKARSSNSDVYNPTERKVGPGDASATELASLVREQDTHEFLVLMKVLFEDLTQLLQRAHAVHHAIWKSLQNLESFRNDGHSGEPNNSEEVVGTVVTPNDAIAAGEALEVVVAVSEEAHARVARLLQLRDEVHSRLGLKDFSALYLPVYNFIEVGEKLCSRPLRGLRGPLLQQSKAFLSNYHGRKMQTMGVLLDSETWQQAEVPYEFQRILDVWGNIDLNGEEHVELHDKNRPIQKALMIQGREIRVVNSALMLLRMVDGYLSVVDILPSLASDVLPRLVEILKFFNSRTCQLLLGAGALQIAGLKSITASHLSLASQCLGLVVAMISHCKSVLSLVLPVRQRVLLVDLDRASSDCSHHRDEIFVKLVTIMKDRVDYHCKLLVKIQWDEAAEQVEGVSQSILSLSKETATLHRKLSQTLQGEEIRSIFAKICDMFTRRIGDHLTSCKVETALGRRRMKQEIKHLLQTLRSLKGVDPPGMELLERIQRMSTTKTEVASGGNTSLKLPPVPTETIAESTESGQNDAKRTEKESSIAGALKRKISGGSEREIFKGDFAGSLSNILKIGKRNTPPPDNTNSAGSITEHKAPPPPSNPKPRRKFMEF